MDPRSFLPLSALDFQVLAVLSGRALHGYGIVHATERLFPDQPAVDVGSLYRIISRLEDSGLIREVSQPADVAASGRKRRFHALTDLGAAVLRAETERVRSLLATAEAVCMRGSSG
jgi:DNA-binding PadR family transcriptional regulator